MMIVSLISYCGEKVNYRQTVFVPPHTANPLDAELYTAAVCRPRSPGRTVHSNASVNQRLLLRQRAGETTATCWLSVIHRCDVINGNLSVQSHTSDK